MHKDSSLQDSWLTTGGSSCVVVSRHKQVKSDDVTTQFLTEGVLEHASITFSLAFTSISAMDFYHE